MSILSESTATTDPLLSPFTLKGLTLRNRIVSTSHEPAYGDGGLAADRYREYHRVKARGGVGLTMIGGSALVSRDSTPAFGNLELWRPETESLLRRLAEDVHAEGAAVMIQITHLGHRTSNYAGDWTTAVSVSDVREPAHRAFAKAAEDWDLERIRDDFVSAAQMVQAAGLDGIELMLYGHFVDSFWTPFWNERTDEFGGPHEQRMRYPLEVIRAIRQGVGEDFIVGARTTFDEEQPGGLGPAEAVQIAGEITEAGIDFISLIRGSMATDADLAREIPTMGMGSAPHLAFAGQIKKQLSVPVMHAGKIADVTTARYAISEGLLDLVGMTRALMADPDLPNKVASRQEDRIRPCVGASMCIDGIYQSGSAYCIHNPSTGRELEIAHRIETATTPKRVAVIGGGPAGLEAARVLAERGHYVEVLEAADRVGGQLLLAASSPRRRDLRGIVDWRIDELARLGVKTHLNTYVEASDLDPEAWDVVLVATGGMPAAPKIPGAQLVLDTWDILSGARRVKGNVVVYDDHGGTQALDAVEALLTRGAQVELITPERSISPDVGSLTAAGYFHALAEGGVTITPMRRLLRVERDGSGVQLHLGMDGFDFTETRKVDAVVAEMGTVPVAEVYTDLLSLSTNGGELDPNRLLDGKRQQSVRNRDGQFQLFRIGDAVTSRNVHSAMLDAARLCRTI